MVQYFQVLSSAWPTQGECSSDLAMHAGISQVSGVTFDSLHAQESQILPKTVVQGLLMIIIKILGGRERRTARVFASLPIG